MPSPGLSAILIVKDEERDLPACLESLRGLADELVVVDDGSSDRTVELARAAGAKIFQRAFDTFAGQKQFALEQATRDWVLSIDADERVTPELAAGLREAMASDRAAGWFVPYEVRFLGRALRWGGMGGERHLRFFRRSAGRFVGGKLHEGIEVDGPVGPLRGKMVHIPYADLDEYLAKLDRYTTLAAKKRFEQGRRSSALHHLLPFWELFQRLVLKLGLLDGKAGIVYAGLSAFHTWVKYIKLGEMQNGGSR